MEQQQSHTIEEQTADYLKGQSKLIDKIVKENMDKVLPMVVEKILGIQIVFREYLPESLQAIRPYRKSVYCYDYKRTRAKDVLHAYISSELSSRQQIAERNRKAAMEAFRASQELKARAEGRVAGSAGPVPAYKIRTPLSVDALAYLFKLLVIAKAIEPGVKTELFAFIAGIFQTPGTGLNGISPGSFEAKYRQVVQSTAKTIRVILVRMLKVLDEEFFNSSV